MHCQLNTKKSTHTLFSSTAVSDTIISIVSASGFLICFVLGCRNSSKSRAWIFGKEHMNVILKLVLIRFYELVVHFERKKNRVFFKQHNLFFFQASALELSREQQHLNFVCCCSTEFNQMLYQRNNRLTSRRRRLNFSIFFFL